MVLPVGAEPSTPGGGGLFLILGQVELGSDLAVVADCAVNIVDMSIAVADGTDPDSIGETKVKRVLVVCTGNICRSPLAEAWLQNVWGSAAHVESAGTGALVGHTADPLAIQVAAFAGLDLSSHRARQVDLKMLRTADLVLAMEASHRDFLIRMAPWATGKVWRFGQRDGLDIEDPYRCSLDKFESVFQSIQRQGQNWLSFVKVP